MDRKRWGIVFCAALLAGLVGYGLLIRGGDRTPRRVEAAPSAEPLKVVPSGEPVETAPSATQPAVPAEEKKGHAFQIRVVWLDTNLPVEGATVTLIPEQSGKTPDNSPRPEGPPESKAPESERFDQASKTGRSGEKTQAKETAQPAISLTGLTDKTGTLSLECPPDLATTGTLRCQVMAEHPGAVPVSYRGVTVSDFRTFHLTLQRAYGYFGTVYRRDAAGKFVPVSGATVSAVPVFEQPLGRSNPSAMATSDAEGHYTIASLSDNVVYLWGQWEDQVTAESKLPVMGKPGERSGPFDLYLEQGASLTALVSDKATLKPIPGATVEVKFAGQGLSRSATADSEGFCEVKGLPLGRIEVFARAEGYAEEFAPMEITSNSKQNTVPFFLDKGCRARILTVWGKDGQPAGNVALNVRGETTREAVSDSDGIAVLDGLKPSTKWSVTPVGDHVPVLVPIGDKRVGVSKTDIPTFTPEVDKTVEVTLRVQNKRGNKSRHKETDRDFVSVEGVVVNEAGEPVPGAIVTANSECCHSSGVTNASGEFQLENACVGIYQSSKGSFPDLEELKKEENEYPNANYSEIDLNHREYYVSRPNYTLSSGASVSCYMGPVNLKAEAQGYAPVEGILAPIDTKPRIVLKERADGTARIRVVDGETKQPVTDYWLRQRRLAQNFNDKENLLRVCSQDGGIVRENLSVEQTYAFTVQSEGYVAETLQKKIEKTPDENQIDVVLNRQKKWLGVVVDAETQEPLSGIEIRQTGFEDVKGILRIFKNLANIPAEETFLTDSKGEFQFSPTKPAGSLLILPSQYVRIAPSFKEIEKYRNPDSGKIVIPLRKSDASLSVTVFIGKEGVLNLASGRLENLEESVMDALPDPVLQDGTCRWENLVPGEYKVSVSSDPKQNYREMTLILKLSARENRVMKIGENDSCCLTGRIMKAGGSVFSGANLSLESESELDLNGIRLTYNYHCPSDNNGAYRFNNIAPGTYTIREYNSKYSETIRVEGNVARDLVIP